VKHETFECDSCGKTEEIGPAIIGWVDLAEVVISTMKEQRRWQICSPTCLSIFAGGFVPTKAPVAKNSELSLGGENPKVGQYL